MLERVEGPQVRQLNSYYTTTYISMDMLYTKMVAQGITGFQTGFFPEGRKCT